MMCVIGKIRIPLLFFLLFLCMHTFAFTVKVCSFNIRYDSGIDGINSWENRKSLLINFLNNEKIDIICLQEVLHHQYNYFTQKLVDYQAVGVGRNDGKTKGEYVPIFIKKKKFEIVEKGTFWLSENPSVIGSKGWDADQPRIVTWVLIKVRKSGKTFLVANTHFDNIGKIARLESANLIGQWVNSQPFPVILTGDFNEGPQSRAYSTIVNQHHIWDCNKIARSLSGVGYTFHSFNHLHQKQRDRIDYVFVKNVKKVKRVEIPREEAINGIFLSDHNPILTILKL